ncbi:MAG: ABC transporter ATP-binding protein [Lysobacterales bacterium 69-70]|nr:ABC-F family ATP-binding cassette domain-containing protein [Xanthomonadaceae bacterium]ODU34577.1 MAG: ABC transporter ATP-binding protein [Xanthomonadaceae bacterium SCN 69-320]ODV19490.1 MAG: ABC transporter ATP-binding protein [Xanthomonadaceae bacterium SCN 69-25]OJY94700.1 MAG: ABC transporter ATP-binding protein [Xanthomonadales bacterium 69-70]
MTNPLLTLDRVSCVLPDGRILFSAIDFLLDRRPVGLVGRNGVGKSFFARLLAGQIAPSAGRRSGTARVHYLPQQITPAPGATVADLAGVAGALQALARIENGGVEVEDFDAVAQRWDLRERFAAALDAHGLGHLDARRPAESLSGGELTRVALLGGWLADADVLVLDEPTNHLDRPQRLALLRQLQDWRDGLLVVSHDRELLDALPRIVELSPAGLADFAGNYTFYARSREAAQARALAELARSRHALRRGEAEQRAQRERQERRQSRGRRESRDANQAPILLGLQKQRSEVSAGKSARLLQTQLEALTARVAQAAGQVLDDPDLALFAPEPAAARRRAAVLEAVELPYGIAAGRPLDLIVAGGQRIGIVGANGSGKSSLLQLLAGRLAPTRGRCVVSVRTACLDQQVSLFDPARSVLEQLLADDPVAGEAILRTRLALLGLDSDTVQRPGAALSGGERLKAALACALYRREPAELLLLDEPDNHLDLAALAALEQMLRQYRGALIVVSHDAVFLDRLALDTRLTPTADGWRASVW